MQVLQIAKAASDELARERPTAARRRLRLGLQRFPGELALLAPYAELLLPLRADGAVEPAPEQASELLRQIERAHAVSGAQLVTQDPEAERQVGLRAALAEAVLGRFEQAFARLVEVGQLQDPITLRCLRRIAVVALQREQLLVAEQALGLARQYMPQDRQLPTELGRVLLARGKTEVALEVLAERVAIEPSALTARADLAYGLAAQGRAGEGLALLAGVRAECERERSCALAAARIALEAARPQEALTFAAPLASARDLDALFVTADAQLRAGDPAAARAAYEQILLLRPESVRARQGLEQLPAR
ncbi:MAG: domain protein putative component of TonB system [Myxococcaceae bacterium]|nr:domain protein putative component of TonB system [Myxococcaceae bacterium]